MSPIEPADIVTSSEDYATRFSGDVGNWFLKVQEEATLKSLLGYERPTILDVGGGHGQVTEALIKNSERLTILGSNDSCSKRVSKYLKANNCNFRIGNYLSLPFENGSYEIVISYRLVAHVEEWTLLLSELTRVAEKAVIIDYPSWRSFNFLTPLMFKLKKKVERNTRTYLLYYERELIREFAKHGFKLQRRFPAFFLPMALHRALSWPLFSRVSEALFRLLGLTYIFGSPIILKLEREVDFHS